MLRLSVCQLSTFRWNFEEDVLQYHAAGYDAIGVWRPKLSDYGEEKAAELLNEHGLKVSSLHWIGGFTGSDGRSAREAMYDALDAVQTAADIGAQTVVAIAGGRGGHTRRHAHRLVRRALTELAEAAQAVNVQLAIEPMHVGCGTDVSCINSIPQCLDLICEIGNPHLGMVFDCYHLALNSDVLVWLEAIVPHVRLVQLGDTKHAPIGQQNRCLLGAGCIPLPQIVKTFHEQGYAGFFEIELLGQSLESIPYGDMLQHSRQVVAQWI
ncbi:MAG: xylose isomerase [Pirellulaceae bacterium]|nr:MAG: xylose isomerase [Pirellulaceae bacterium]